MQDSTPCVYILRDEENVVRGSWELGRVEVTPICHIILSVLKVLFQSAWIMFMHFYCEIPRRIVRGPEE